MAKTCVEKLGLSIPVVVDRMDNKVAKEYAASLIRLYVLDKEGRVAYKSRRGPRGLKLEEMEKALKKVLGDS